MILTEPKPFKEALQAMADKVAMPTDASSAQLAQLAPALRERALFSARTTNANYLQKISDVVTRIVSPETRDGRPTMPGEYMDPATGRLELKKALQSIGYHPDPNKRGGIQDLSSDARLNLIVKTNTEMAQGYGSFVRGQDPGALDAWPAQELYRLESRLRPRDWVGRWLSSGGKVYGGKMIALKNSPIWTDMSRFGLPYPPFDFNSGMWVRDVALADAVSFGLITRAEDIPQPQQRPLNEDVWTSASPAQQRSGLLDSLLASMGKAAQLVDGIIRLRG